MVGGDAAARRDVQGHIVRDRQHIFRRIHIRPAKFELQAVELRLPVHRVDHTVLGRVVLLGQATGDHLEHTAVADKVDRSGILLIPCINVRMENFFSACINGQRRLNILDIILRKRKNTVFHTSRRCPAAEVADLEPLIYLGTALCGNRAVAGNKAPCIQRAAIFHGNRRAGVQPEVAIVTDHSALLTATGRVVLTAHADRALDRQSCVARQHQLAVYLGSRHRPKRLRRFLIQGGGIIKRHQQRNAGGDGITARQCAVSGDDDGLVRAGLRRSNGIAQVRIRLTANAECCRSACTGVRLWLNSRRRNHLCLAQRRQLNIVRGIRICYQHCRKQCRKQQCHQRHGQKALENLLHFFLTLLFFVCFSCCAKKMLKPMMIERTDQIVPR